MTMGNYAAAVDAFEKVVELESSQDAQSLVSLGEALLANTGASIDGRIAALFENALALEPNNPQALFYGGIGAFNRNDAETAANRWEQLLALNPPAEIQGVLQQRIAEWRGEAPPAMAQAAPAPATTSPAGAPAQIDRPGVVVAARISLGEAAISALPAEATVYVIARDPAQPVPPIAVARRRLSELPATVELGDRESMVPGRELSGFAEFELLARVSVSGQPGARSGDWFGSVIVKPSENNSVALSIDQQVP
jgi:cytochrome c-type biogenesis protein CcmH